MNKTGSGDKMTFSCNACTTLNQNVFKKKQDINSMNIDQMCFEIRLRTHVASGLLHQHTISIIQCNNSDRPM